MPMAWFSVLPITSAVRFLAFPIPLVKGLKVPVSTGSCVLGRMRASVGGWLSSVLLVSLGGRWFVVVTSVLVAGEVIFGVTAFAVIGGGSIGACGGWLRQ